jgi:hypothetical protein
LKRYKEKEACLNASLDGEERGEERGSGREGAGGEE